MERSKVNITTFRKERIYRDVQALPPELRRACEAEQAEQAGGANVIHIEGTSKIIIDGKEFAGIEDMPDAVRREYEQLTASWKASDGRQVTTEITVNGHKYTSVEEMPPGVRRAYEEAIAVLHGPAAARSGTRFTEIIFNGHKYAGVEEMPADVRREYEGLLAKMNDTDENQRFADAAPTPNEQVNYFCCRHCGKVVKAMENQGGMQGKCPSCGEMTSIPYVSTAEETAGAEFVSTGAVHRRRHT